MIERHIPAEQAGWVNIGGRTWRLPDGACYTFKDGVDQVVPRFEPGPAPREYGRKAMPTGRMID
jgi:hypothetical protein